MLSDAGSSSASDADLRVVAGGLLALRFIERDNLAALTPGKGSSSSLSPASSPPEWVDAVMAALVPLSLPRPPLGLPLVVLFEADASGFDFSLISSVWIAEEGD